MACTNCFTARQLMASVGAYDSSCTKMVYTVNRILRNFYFYTKDLNENRITKTFSLIEGENEVTADLPIYQVLGFFGISDDACLKSIPSLCTCQLNYGCGSCANLCNSDEYKRLPLQERWGELNDRQYKISQDCDEVITIKVPIEIDDAFVVYARGPEEVNTMADDICMSQFLRTGLEFLAEWMRYTSREEYNNANFKNSEFMKRLEEAKNIEAKAVEFINP